MTAMPDALTFSPRTKAWIVLVLMVITEGSGVAAIAHTGGASLFWALLAGLGAGCGSVLHALLSSPNDKPAAQ